MSFLDVFRPKKIAEQAVKEAIKTTRPAKIDSDFARTKEIINMVNSLAQNRPQNDMSGFFSQMANFEQFKRAMVDSENDKLEQLREQISQEYSENDDGLNLDQIMGIIGGLQKQKAPQNPPINPQNGYAGFAEPLNEPLYNKQDEEVPKVELDGITKTAIKKAKKKIPKVVLEALKSQPPEKQQAIFKELLN